MIALTEEGFWKYRYEKPHRTDQPRWQAIRGWLPDEEAEAPATDTLELWDQSTDQAWKAPEVDLGDGRILVLEYPE